MSSRVVAEDFGKRHADVLESSGNDYDGLVGSFECFRNTYNFNNGDYIVSCQGLLFPIPYIVFETLFEEVVL